MGDRGRPAAPQSVPVRCPSSCRNAPHWCRRRASPPCRRAKRRRPGSIGKNRPLSRRCRLSSLRVTPASTTQSRSSAWTAITAFHTRRVDRDTAERRVDVAFEGRANPEGNDRQCDARRKRARRPRLCVVSGNTTASGGSFGTSESWLPCWTRIGFGLSAARRSRASKSSAARPSAAGSPVRVGETHSAANLAEEHVRERIRKAVDRHFDERRPSGSRAPRVKRRRKRLRAIGIAENPCRSCRQTSQNPDFARSDAIRRPPNISC